MEKRGQLTLFIILGIIIAALIIGVVMYKDYLFGSSFDRAKIRSSNIPPDALLVKEFIDSCVVNTAKDGLNLIGLQGGRLQLQEARRTTFDQFGNNLDFFTDNSLKVSYWFYQEENSLFVEDIPDFNSIEQELAGYVEDNVRICFDNFTEFKERGYEFEDSEIKVAVNIVPKKIQVTMDYPLKIRKGEFEFVFSKFFDDLNVRFAELYALAKNILEREKEDLYLEDKTLDMMFVYPEIPVSDSSLECAPLIWSKSKIESDFKQIVSTNLPAIKILGTDFEFPEERLKYFGWDIDGKDHSGISARLIYSVRWPFEMRVEPSQGELLKAEQITNDVGPAGAVVNAFVCLQQYNFVYDVRYPVIVILDDSEAFDGEGFTLQYAMQVVINRNQPRVAKILPESIGDVSDRKYCDQRFNTGSVAVAELRDGALFPITGVDVKYKCINHLCDIGKTKRTPSNEAVIEALFPSCINGFVMVSKEGYHAAKQMISSNEDFFTSVIMKKVVEVPYEISVMRDVGVTAPYDDEMIFIYFENADDDYNTMLSIPGDNVVKLIPGSYDVSAYIFSEDRNGIRLDGREFELCYQVPKKGITAIFGDTEEECETVKIPATTLKSVMTGGVDFAWDVSEDDLEKDYVRFYLPYLGKPTTYDQLALYYSLIENNTLDVREPRFLNRE